LYFYLTHLFSVLFTFLLHLNEHFSIELY